MPRGRDDFWEYVKCLDNNVGNNKKWKCNFCCKEWRGGATRIKAHLGGVGGKGIDACEVVNGGVRSKARKALKGKGLADSSNGSEGNVRGPSNLIGDLATDMPGPVNAGEFSQDARTNNALLDSRPTCELINEDVSILKRKPDELRRKADMIELELWCGKAKRIRGEFWSTVHACREDISLSPQQAERVNELSKEFEDLLGHCSFRKGSETPDAGCRKSLPLVTTELVGGESKETIEEICDYLMKDEIFVIGIFGMGGVGKTAILMHVHNRVLENPAFNDVFWVTVPQEFSIFELQDEIANAVGLEKLSNVKDVKRRAGILDSHLKKKKRSVLLLDGLWTHFEAGDVGIPSTKGGLKLVLTTRSLDVCHKMLCQEQIMIRPLCEEDDSQSLFFEKLCYGKEIPSEVEEIACSILDKCGGLPLGIIEIATLMRGVEKVHAWKDLLQKLEDSRMELDVFKKLKLSYTNLDDIQVQQCFLHLVLCFKISYRRATKEDLIESLIVEGLLGETATRQEQHDQGNTILDKIENACLWVHQEEVGYLDVHPLIMYMALEIVTSTTHMVKVDMSLEEIPKEELWTEHLEKVFLQYNRIKEISFGISPNCPKLTRLSLNGNTNLKVIHESFFKHLNGLKVLDLSLTMITELPYSFSQLESLEALLLRSCWELRRIPCVRKLGSLRKLDLNGCKMLEEVPEGMEMLVKLRYLDLLGTRIETLREGVLGKLVNLQYLAIKMVRAGEEIKLKNLEALYCSVPNVEAFNACARFLEQNSPREYHLALNASEEDYRGSGKRVVNIERCNNITTCTFGGIGGDGRAPLIPENVRVLKVKHCDGMTSLYEVGPLRNNLMVKELGPVLFPRLEEVKITRCSKLKHLFKWEGMATPLPNPKMITINDCEELEEIISTVRNIAHSSFPYLRHLRLWNLPELKSICGGALSWDGIEEIDIWECPKLKRIPLELPLRDNGIPSPPSSLQRISINFCEKLEEILSTAPNTTHSSFPYLRCLELRNLPELKSICDGTLSCDSIEGIDIWKCPKLKRIPLQLPLLDNGLPSSPPSLQCICIDRHTWESLEWDHPQARSSLQHLVSFYLF